MFFGINQEETQQQEEVRNYTKVEMVLGRIPQLNQEKEDKCIFLAPELNLAYASTLRSARLWGASDLLVRYHGEIDVEIDFETDNSQEVETVGNEGIYFPENKELVRIPGLLGAHTPNGRRMLTPAGADEVFNEIQQNGFAHQIAFNPKEMLKYIEGLLAYSPENTKTISLMPSKYMNNKSHFVAKLSEETESVLEGPKLYAVSLFEHVNSHVVKDSLIEFSEDDYGKLFMFEHMGEVVENNMIERQARLIMPFEPGIHVAIQNYPSGHVLPVFDSYSVIIGENNNTINDQTKTVFPFTESQDKKTENSGPMLTFVLSTFRAAVIAMQEYKEVEMWYNTSHDKVYMVANNNDGQIPYQVEAIISPLSQYRYGKILSL